MFMGEWFQESSPEVKKIDKITQWIGDLPASNTSKIFWGVKDLTPTERISTPRTRKIVSTPQRRLPMTTRGQRKCPFSPLCHPPVGDPRITVQPIKNTTNHSIRFTLYADQFPYPTRTINAYANTFLRTNAKPVKPTPKSIAVPPPSYTGCAPAADEKEKFAGLPLDGSCVENDQEPGVSVNPAYFSVPVPVTETLAGDPPCEKIPELNKSNV